MIFLSRQKVSRHTAIFFVVLTLGAQFGEGNFKLITDLVNEFDESKDPLWCPFNIDWWEMQSTPMLKSPLLLLLGFGVLEVVESVRIFCSITCLIWTNSRQSPTLLAMMKVEFSREKWTISSDITVHVFACIWLSVQIHTELTEHKINEWVNIFREKL